MTVHLSTTHCATVPKPFSPAIPPALLPDIVISYAAHFKTRPLVLVPPSSELEPTIPPALRPVDVILVLEPDALQYSIFP